MRKKRRRGRGTTSHSPAAADPEMLCGHGDPDTDGDYSPDGEEVDLNTDPLSARSAPLTLLPVSRRLEMSFTWNGTTSLPATYRHGLKF